MDDENLFDTENIDDDDEEEDDLTLEQVIQLLEEAWMNEKLAPEILPHKTEIVEVILGQITNMEGRTQELESTDFRKGICQLEIDRLRFLVTSYLRLRLEKIETYCAHILQQERQRSEKNEDFYLNQNELEFAQDFEKNLNDHFESILHVCPDVLDPQSQIVAPNIFSMVFLKSKKHVDGLVIDDGNGDNNDLIEVDSGSQILISYNSVSSLVKNGDGHLI